MSNLIRLNPVFLPLFLTVTLLSGCGEIKVRAGHRVEPSLLESKLTMGQSTSEDIREVLGEPTGMGRELLPLQTKPRTVMSYYFEESQASLSGSSDSHRVFVWVFLNDGRYDGYLWVSGFPSDRQNP